MNPATRTSSRSLQTAVAHAVAILMGIVVATPTRAQWVSLGGPEGTGRVSAVECTPDGLFAAFDLPDYTSLGLFRYDNGTWAPLGLAELDPVDIRGTGIDGRTLIVSCAAVPYVPAIAVSTDGGSTFDLRSPISMWDYPYHLLVHRQLPTVLYALNPARKAFRSTDEGVSWEAGVGSFGLGTVWTGGAVSPEDPLTAYATFRHPGEACFFRGIAMTTDGGASWTTFDSSLLGCPHTVGVSTHDPGAFYTATGDSLFRVVGDAWDGGKVLPGAEQFTYQWFDLALPDWALDTIYLAGAHCPTKTLVVFRSTDGGSSWEDISDGLSVEVDLCNYLHLRLRWSPSDGRLFLVSAESPHVWMRQETVTADVPSSESGESATQVHLWPNPSDGQAWLSFVGSEPLGATSIVLRDVRGRVLRHLVAYDSSPILLGGIDDQGSTLPSGVYFIETGRARACARWLIIR